VLRFGSERVEVVVDLPGGHARILGAIRSRGLARLTQRARGIQRAREARDDLQRPRLEWEAGVNCQHMGCRCQAAEGREFCGDYCREHAADAAHEEHQCDCGHDACTMAAV
jgi:hypothetical protein